MHKMDYQVFKDKWLRASMQPFPFKLIVILKKINHSRSYEVVIEALSGVANAESQMVLLTTQLEESDFRKYKYCVEKISGFEKMDYGKKAIAYVYPVKSADQLDAIYNNCVSSLDNVEFSEFI